MRLDHVSYVTSHDQLADTVQRLGSRLGTSFVDGGIHPRFGTRNFTAPLLNNQYLEVVCPLDHPAAEQTPWGKAVTNKVNEGGGWLTWVFSTQDISSFEARFGREAIEAHRTRPDGSELVWKQIGVKDISESRTFPFFIEWNSNEHPSLDGIATAEIQSITMVDSDQLKESWFREEIFTSLGKIKINWETSNTEENNSGIKDIHFLTPTGLVVLD
jgi:hypothetical protein